MLAEKSAREVASALLAENDLSLSSCSLLQSLWAGYGQICHVTASPRTQPGQSQSTNSKESSPKDSGFATPNDTSSYILKLITPPSASVGDEGHARKILSYQVEQYFYSHLAPQLPRSVPVASCLASINEHHHDGTSTTAMILNDLRQNYPIAGEKRTALFPKHALAALDWLSNFHGFWWPCVNKFERETLVLPPLEEMKRGSRNAQLRSVWLNGGYTYLATRQTEYKDLQEDHESEWAETLTHEVQGESLSIAQLVAAFLDPESPASSIEDYTTLVHGDVKSENLFASALGDQVAFYDFQYVGLGLGVCDLAKLFTCSVPLNMLVGDEKVPHVLSMQEGEKQLLERYREQLVRLSGRKYDWDVFRRHWEIALVDWLRFQASWGFWGNKDWLQARVRSILRDEEWRASVRDAVAARR